MIEGWHSMAQSIPFEEHLKTQLNKVGWFTPPYISIGLLSNISNKQLQKGLDQKELETFLSEIYTLKHLSRMSCEIYPKTPFVKEYLEIIYESIEAHALGLDHIAVTGLIPVIEGTIKKYTNDRGISLFNNKRKKNVQELFEELSTDLKEYVIDKKLGAVNEVISMIDSFIEYLSKNIYIKSQNYTLEDNTNRHGILHGILTDNDYGSPINYYKVISAIDFLCFAISIHHGGRWWLGDTLVNSTKLYMYLCRISLLGIDRKDFVKDIKKDL